MTEQPEQHRVNAGPAGNLDLDWLFSYHAPTPEQIPLFEAIRDQGKQLAVLIAQVCPPGADRSLAISRVRESVMWANSAIANASPRPAEEEPVEVQVTLPNNGVERCEASSYNHSNPSPRQPYGPGGYNRCVRALGHDQDREPDSPSTPHTDEWGNQWRIVDGGFRQIGTLDKPRLLALIEAEGTGVNIT